MIIIRLFLKGESLGTEREWPVVPRIGESLSLNGNREEYEVVKIAWHAAGGSLVANVHIEDSKGGTSIA
jgi:hypothetical protein